MECLNYELLKAYQRGEISVVERDKLEEHLEVCEACRANCAHLDSTQDDFAKRPIGLIVDSQVSDSDYDFHMRMYEAGFVVEKECGKGAFGIVYKARQLEPDRIVALKVIRPELLDSPAVISRFQREANAVARLQHANVVQIFEVGKKGGPTYLAMEYVEGDSLARKLEQGPLPGKQTARLMKALADAVHHAHVHLVIHRDLKPGNVLLTGEGSPKVADFGLAKLLSGDQQTITHGVVGTPAFMAPEQAVSRQSIGAATDVHALGAILYNCLTGQPPFCGETQEETLHKVVHEDPIPPSQANSTVPPDDLETICLKCLHKEPESRYASAKELASDLNLYLNGEPIDARPREYRGRWTFSHEKAYAGEVWVQLIPKPENRQRAHEYKIRWGPCRYRSEWDFNGHRSVTLLHMKDSPLHSIPLYIDVSPPCHVRVGHGDRPLGDSRNINAEWTFSLTTFSSWLGVWLNLMDFLHFIAGSLLHALGLARDRRTDQRTTPPK